MPSRWWVPLDLEPRSVQLEHVHAAVSRWFDADKVAHDAQTKAYSVSPLGNGDDGLGLEVSVLTDEALDRLRVASRPGQHMRLGSQVIPLSGASLIAEESWASLDQPSGTRSWDLQLLTPTTFRRRNRSTPLPVAASLLRGLQQAWNLFSCCPERALTPQQSDQIWVATIEGRSECLRLSGLAVSGFVGDVGYRADSQELADLVDPLFRLAPYAGVGSFRGKGMGVARLIHRNRRRGDV